MAVDEVLLESADAGVATLRFYQWSEPTLSLGYFQSAADRQQHVASRELAVVRRSTGGGAILHDAELTYSLALPDAKTGRRDNTWLYQAVHDALLAALRHWNVSAAQFCGSAAANQREAFLCFERRAQGDVVSGEVKVCGSAQRRRHGAVLQHGSLLLRASASAAELPGLREAANVEPDQAELIALWSGEVAKRLRLALEPSGLTHGESERSRALADGKYGQADWTCRR